MDSMDLHKSELLKDLKKKLSPRTMTSFMGPCVRMIPTTA